jgi:hypothetical protein
MIEFIQTRLLKSTPFSRKQYEIKLTDNEQGYEISCGHVLLPFAELR